MSTRYASGLAASYSAGRKRVREIAEDIGRVAFINRLCKASTRFEFTSNNPLTKIEDDFIWRIANTVSQASPDLHPGDRNICDSLRRKFEPALDRFKL